MDRKRFSTTKNYLIVGQEQSAELTYSTNPVRNSVTVRPAKKVTPKSNYMKK